MMGSLSNRETLERRESVCARGGGAMERRKAAGRIS
jgi:hypothetical protein